METFLFFLFSGIAVVSAILVVSFRNPIYSALSLVAVFFALAGLFVLLNAYFLAVVQVIVYAGAIMVLFLFVIMLLNLGSLDTQETATGRYRVVAVIFLAITIVAQLSLVAGREFGVASDENLELLRENIPYIGTLLYTDFLFPFEVASIILLVGIIGVVVLVKRESSEKVDEIGIPRVVEDTQETGNVHIESL